jgi:hypothetical protein
VTDWPSHALALRTQEVEGIFRYLSCSHNNHSSQVTGMTQPLQGSVSPGVSLRSPPLTCLPEWMQSSAEIMDVSLHSSSQETMASFVTAITLTSLPQRQDSYNCRETFTPNCSHYGQGPFPIRPPSRGNEHSHKSPRAGAKSQSFLFL